jgi:hypothetical protein
MGVDSEGQLSDSESTSSSGNKNHDRFTDMEFANMHFVYVFRDGNSLADCVGMVHHNLGETGTLVQYACVCCGRRNMWEEENVWIYYMIIHQPAPCQMPSTT